MDRRGRDAGAPPVSGHRILAISTLYPNSHTPRFGTFVARSLEALAARGDWDVTLINPIGLPPIRCGRYRALARAARDGVEGGMRVHRPTFPLIPGLSGAFNPALIARAILPLARRLHAEKPFDLVDAQFFYPDGPAAQRIADALGLPFSIKARGADIAYWGARPFPRRQMLAAARDAAGLLAVSRALAADMAALEMPRDKITLHYTGLDRARFRLRDRAAARSAVAQMLGLSPGPLLLTVGALIPRKGQAIAIRALADIPQAILGLVGAGPDEGELRDLARSLGLAERVRFVGPVDHETLPLLLAAGDALVSPSLSEGLANAWVEALACGTPLVVTDAGGARELMTRPEAGRIVARDPAAVARGVQEILAAPPAPEAVAAAVSGFSWEENAAALAAHYEAMLASGA